MIREPGDAGCARSGRSLAVWRTGQFNPGTALHGAPFGAAWMAGPPPDCDPGVAMTRVGLLSTGQRRYQRVCAETFAQRGTQQRKTPHAVMAGLGPAIHAGAARRLAPSQVYVRAPTPPPVLSLATHSGAPSIDEIARRATVTCT